MLAVSALLPQIQQQQAHVQAHKSTVHLPQMCLTHVCGMLNMPEWLLQRVLLLLPAPVGAAAVDAACMPLVNCQPQAQLAFIA